MNRVHIKRLFTNKKLFVLTAFVLFSAGIKAQQGILTAGIEYKRFFPLEMLNISPTIVRDDGANFEAIYDPTGGYGLGMVVRYGLSPIWSIESGITLNNRNFNFSIRDLDSAYTESKEFKVVGYEIPIKALAYIQFADDLFMNVAFGMSTDFIASDVETIGYSYIQRSFKQSWIQLALIANVGMEYRTEESGYFYIGASYHNPFKNIMVAQVNYYDRNALVGYVNTDLKGNYFSLDFRYFFKPKSEQRSKRPSIPLEDW